MPDGKTRGTRRLHGSRALGDGVAKASEELGRWKSGRDDRDSSMRTSPSHERDRLVSGGDQGTNEEDSDHHDDKEGWQLLK